MLFIVLLMYFMSPPVVFFFTSNRAITERISAESSKDKDDSAKLDISIEGNPAE
eukprot:CAMPEP_0203788762 /NCGR_PEP_ID=MMETSP0100_2-20121128/3040_1 /ASSEMBLY_ACC=CAM_ASM_000210 /TAXON_ID=96639 /ORGANISM=" , Strain NY0313808BC1" /LENGTH=53 /DNA_ID=CAMNT_0050691567 /DNA_START=554 /DNA_END=715 /DNA_ORIENTATION=-